MKVYHTYESGRGFDYNNLDYDRGVFAIPAWWVGKPGYEKYSEWTPNEFGDKVVELEIDDGVKTYTDGEQIDFIVDNFKGNPAVEAIIDKYDRGNFRQEDWQKLDKFIGKHLKKKGYKLIHYTDDPMYGNVWVILDKHVIKSMKFGPEKKA